MTDTGGTFEIEFGPTGFAVLAMLLAAGGIYGVVSCIVAQRTQEMGVRMALGASRGNVVWMVVRQGMKFVIAGVALGLFASFGLTRVLKSFLYGISPTDSLTFAIAPALIVSGGAGGEFRPGAPRCQHRSGLCATQRITLRYGFGRNVGGTKTGVKDGE